MIDVNLTDLARRIHHTNIYAGWWQDVENLSEMERIYVLGTKIALMHSELSEALEGLRTGVMDDKLPHRKAEEVELADALIRILDYCGYRGFDIASAMGEKLAYNSKREDHKPKARAAEGGKKF